MIPAHEALTKLIEGNKRFASGTSRPEAPLSHARRAELVRKQQPFAIVLGCSDSRVPVEMVFDQGQGDLFVIRVAGNIVAPSQLGSIEFAASLFKTRLVVVLGHTQCGAIQATIEQLLQPLEDQSPNLHSLVERVRPAVENLLSTDLRHKPDELAHQAVRANVQIAADHIRHGSQIIESLIRDEGLRVVGAEYALETGIVDFFDRPE